MQPLDGQVHHDTHAVPMGNYVIAVGNYVIVTRSQVGNYVSADRITDDAVLAQAAGAFAAKWDGRWQFTARGGCFRGLDGRGEALVFSVNPAKVFAHAKGDPFGATRHKF